jgi:hypothetical protein
MNASARFPRSRGSALAWMTLEKEGYVFEAKHQHGDYVHRLVSAPAANQLSL